MDKCQRCGNDYVVSELIYYNGIYICADCYRELEEE